MLFFWRNLNRRWTASQEDSPDEMIPKTKGIEMNDSPAEITLLNSNNPAIVIAGMPRIKENLAAESLSQPLIKAAVMVMPDLDTTGIKAKAWKHPMRKPSNKVKLLKFFFLLLWFSAIKRAKAIIIDMVAINGIDLITEFS